MQGYIIKIIDKRYFDKNYLSTTFTKCSCFYSFTGKQRLCIKSRPTTGLFIAGALFEICGCRQHLLSTINTNIKKHHQHLMALNVLITSWAVLYRVYIYFEFLDRLGYADNLKSNTFASSQLTL